MALSLLLLLEAVLVLVLLEAEAVDSDGGSGAAVSSREGIPSSSLVLRFLSLSFSPLSSSSLVFFPPPFPFFRFTLLPLPFLSLSVFSVLLSLLCFFRFLLLPPVRSPRPPCCCVGCYL